MDERDFRQALITIQMEYVEMPGLKLTVAQAARLWVLPAHVCQAAFGALQSAGFLAQDARGAYGWRGTSPVRVEPVDPRTWSVAPAGAHVMSAPS